MKRGRTHAWWAPYFFVAPFVLTFAVFTVYPMLSSVVLAFHQTHGPDMSTARFVGFANFQWLWENPDFAKAMRNTFVFAAGSVFIQLPVSLGLALLLNRPDVKLRAVWRMVFFAPSLVGLAFVAILAALVFEKNEGLLNVILHEFLGIGFAREFPWLQEYVMPALILCAVWMYAGFNMVYFLAALQNVSQDLLDAASVDGANAWHRFLHVTVPAIKPVAGFVVLLSLIGSFQLFELPYLLLGNSGGPDNQGLTVVMYLFQRGFDGGDLGFASAIGWVLAVLLMGFAMIYQYRLSRAERV